MLTLLLVLNLFVSLVSAFAGVIALFRPEMLSGASHARPGDMFYPRMYAARAIPIGLFAGILPFFANGPEVAWVLFTAALIQLADIIIALRKKDSRMMTGASFATAVYLLCGFAVR